MIEQQTPREKDYVWMFYEFMGYRCADDDEDEKNFNEFIQKILSSQQEKFDAKLKEIRAIFDNDVDLKEFDELVRK